MRKFYLSLWLNLVVLAASALGPASAHDIVLDAKTAHAVIVALSEPTLSEAKAREIAKMPGNQALVQKMLTYSDEPNEARLVTELLASAHGQVPSGKIWYDFDDVKRNRDALLRTLSALETNEAAIKSWINGRIEPVSPPGPPRRLEGFFIAGGRATGFSPGTGSFYLNLASFKDDPDGAKVILAHELYHAVQSTALESKKIAGEHEFSEQRLSALTAKPDRDRYFVGLYLSNLLDEGSADYVGDFHLMTGPPGSYSAREKDNAERKLSRPERLTGLLDMALIALTADQPINYTSAMRVAFNGDQPLYYLGYAMAKAVVEKEGGKRLGELVAGSGCGFTKDYLALAATDPELIQLGAATRRLVGQYC